MFLISRTRKFITYIFMLLLQYLYYPKSKCFKKHTLLKINTSRKTRLKVLKIVNENLSVYTVIKSVISLRSPIIAALRYRNTNITLSNLLYFYSFMQFNRNINITCQSFFPVYNKSRQVSFALRNNGATAFFKDRL